VAIPPYYYGELKPENLMPGPYLPKGSPKKDYPGKTVEPTINPCPVKMPISKFKG
jgi:hypothetical protein